MKKILSLLFLFVSPLFLTTEPLSKEATPAQIFGVLDSTAVFVESKLGTTGFTLINELQTTAEQELYALEAKIDAIDESEESKAIRSQVELQAALYSLQTVLDNYQQTVVAIIEETLEIALEQIRTEKNIPIIFAKETIISYNPECDVTQEVIAILDSMEVEFPSIPVVTLPDPAQPLENAEE